MVRQGDPGHGRPIHGLRSKPVGNLGSLVGQLRTDASETWYTLAGKPPVKIPINAPEPGSYY